MTNLLAVNLHGLINTRSEVRTTLVELGIGKRFAATIVKDDPSTMGALKLCKDYVAWCPVDEALLSSLLENRGRVSSVKRLDAPALKALGYKDHAELASKMLKQEWALSSISGLKPFFGLSPPRGGFKRSSRRQFREGGVLGENPKLPDIVKRMI
ncbi:MAG: uL30 family ribosomal protein [Thaumarchaeota archaeon]|nr:uL30 family ribosomal protein [Nitrososphaerota archaeon]MDA4135659.1 uL30 family ribosomal protein [Nitrososphaerota archaeon]